MFMPPSLIGSEVRRRNELMVNHIFQRLQLIAIYVDKGSILMKDMHSVQKWKKQHVVGVCKHCQVFHLPAPFLDLRADAR